MGRRYTTILLILSIVVVISILLLNLNTFYWLDDYLNLKFLKSKGIIRSCVDGYFNWDGRMISFAAFVQHFLLKYVRIEFITLFYNILFLISGFFAFNVVKTELHIKSDSTRRIELLMGLLFAIFFWFGSYKHVSETIYWATGGGYTTNLFLGVLWLVIFFRIRVGQSKLKIKAFFLFYSFYFIGMGTQNMSVAFVVFLIIEQFIYYADNNRMNKFYLINTITILIGIAIIALAPGSFKRLNEQVTQDNMRPLHNSSFVLSFVILKIFRVLF